MELHNTCVFAKDSKNSQEIFFSIKNAPLFKKNKLLMLFTDT